MFQKLLLRICFPLLFLGACQSKNSDIPVVGFVDAFEDATISQAREGFVAALKNHGYNDDDKTIEILYRNAQGDIPTLTQIVNYFISEKVDLIAANTTLSTITALQRTQEIPVFMMVSSEPEQMHLVDAAGKDPINLFGVGETLSYIDTSFALIPEFIKPKDNKIVVGMIYNQSEPQSVDAMERVAEMARKLNIVVEAMPLTSSADAQLVTQALLNENIDVFFANPDNTVFASFETILKNCNQNNIPIFTSEAGLVKRGAVAAFGADIYQWGYQAGEQAALYLKNGTLKDLHWEIVKVRKRVYNLEMVKRYNLTVPEGFEAIE